MNNDELYTPVSDNNYEVFATPGAESGPEVYVTPLDVPDQEYIQDRLSKAKDNKLKALTNRNDNADLSDSFTLLDDGRLEHNGNKMYNDMSDLEIQSLNAFAAQRKQLTATDDGSLLDADGNVYTGSTRRLYTGYTKNGDSDTFKLGLSRGDKPNSSYRYLKELGGWESGEKGLDVNRFESDNLYDYGVATMLEAVNHGRRRALEGRAIPDTYADPFAKKLYGDGVTEYYKSKDALFGKETEVDLALGEKLFNQYMAKLPERHREFRVQGSIGRKLDPNYVDNNVDTQSGEYLRISKLHEEAAADRGLQAGDVVDSTTNALAGFASSFVNELLVKPADAVGDLTGLYDLDTNGDSTKSVEDFFGYNPESAEKSMKNIGQQWDIASNSEASMSDRVKAAGNGILEALTTPEMLGTSLGTLLAWVSPGSVFKALGVGSKYLNTVGRIDKLVDAGKLTKSAGRLKKAKAFMSVDGAKNFVASQSGHISSSLGNVNKQYEEFVQHNNGVELEGSEKARWMAGRFAVQIINQNIDKLVDVKVMTSPGTLKALVPAVKAMTNKEFGNFTATMLKGLTTTAVAAGSEAVQEYAQTAMELHNSRFGSEQFKDLDTYVKFLTDEGNVRESGIAALAGAGGSMQFEAVGAVLPAVAFGAGTVANKTSEVLSKKESSPVPVVNGVPATEDEIKDARNTYSTLLKRTATYTVEKGVNETNVGMLLDDLDELNNTKHVLKDVDPDTAKSGEEIYEIVASKLEEFVVSNPTLKLSKRMIRKTVQESAQTLGSSPEQESNADPDFEELDYDDDTRAATVERIIRTVLGSKATITNDFKTKAAIFGVTNGIPEKKAIAIIKSYASVDEDATSGKRGYHTRLSKLRGLVESSNPNEKAITRERNELLSMYSTILNSKTELERGVEGAKAEAISLNKGSVSTKSTAQFVTEYKKSDGKPYVIHLKRVNGKWSADTKGAEKLAAVKDKYTSEIMAGFKSIDSKNFTGVGNVAPTTGRLIVPVKAHKNEGVRTADVSYMEKISKAVKDVIPASEGISKVILGAKTSAKWKIGGDYHKANSTIVNDTSFNENDVVMINSTSVIENKKGGKEGYTPDLGKDGFKSLKAALDAGSTIVLDSDMVKGRAAKSNHKMASSIAGYIGKTHKEYVKLEGADRYVFVKNTPENRQAIKKKMQDFKAEKAEKASVDSSKSRAITIKRSLDSGLNTSTLSELTRLERRKLEIEYESVRKTLLEKKFDSEDKLNRFIDRAVQDEVVNLSKEILNDPNPSATSYDDKILEKQIEEYISEETNKDEKGAKVLKEWGETASQGLTSKDRESGVLKTLESFGLKARELVDKVFGEKSFVTGKNDLYESVYEVIGTGALRVVPLRSKMSKDQYDKLIKLNESTNKKEIFLGSRRVVQDMTKIAGVTKTTVVNSVPLDMTPFSVRDAVASLVDSAKKSLMHVEPAELAEQTYSKDENGRILDGGFNLHNSPARGLFFNNEGKVNEEVITATYLALGDVLVSDRQSMSRGWKSDFDVAKMFGVQEFEVTQDMRQFAYTHGVLLKTSSSSLGKAILGQLGITKKVGSDISSSEYEAFISDVGNTALIIAEKEGLVKSEPISSNDMSEMYKSGEKRKVDTNTHFVHLADVSSKSGKFESRKPNELVEGFIAAYKEVAESMPEVSTTRKDWYFSKPDNERLEKAKSEVRNDISGKQVPEEGKQALDILMDTPYTADLDRINEVLDAVNAEGSQFKENMGFVDLESAKFKAMYFVDKEVQEAKNNAINKSIDELTLLKERIEGKGSSNTDMYFDYFYSSNDRYMLDANTINPQVDKLHRFLVVPKGHKLDYSVVDNGKGGLEFYVGDKEDPNSDQSFAVRMALTQAFGQSVDKMNFTDIAAFGNTMLSMSLEQLNYVKSTLLEKGKMHINSEGVEYELEAEHVSHTLQALHFLREIKNSPDGNVTSSLSMEFDSLTSGFANKIQQMPILNFMNNHLARTGVITREYLQTLKDNDKFKGAGVEFNSEKGHSVADLLATEGFLDSYKNMAQVTIGKLSDGDKQLSNLTHSSTPKMLSGFSIFEAIKPMLPGGEFIGGGDVEVKISGIIRNLFKNPFMIFNYSASVGRIVKNLSYDVTHGLVKTIATADFSDPESEKLKSVTENMIKHFKILIPDSEILITTVEEFQVALRDGRLKDIKLKFPVVVSNPKPPAKGKKLNNLEAILEAAVAETYGEVVRDVFNDFFEPFTKFQDAMNDTFKVAFRVFDKKRMKLLKEVQKNKEDRFLSEEDHAKVLEDLWDDFPWIVGPLTGADSKKEVIAVVTTSVKSPNPIMESRKKTQAVFSKGSPKATRTVSPLVKYLEEAVSSGSVLPFHAIDGAEMARTLISSTADMDVHATAAIHDAVIAPLNMSDKVGFNYQKGMADTNRQYVLVDEINGLTDRMYKTLNSPEFEKEFKDVTVLGLKTLDKEDGDLKFPAVAKKVTSYMKTLIQDVKKERNDWYGKGGKLEGAQYGNLVGTPGAIYRTGYSDENNKWIPETTAPNLAYKQEFKKTKLYRSAVVGVEKKVAPKAKYKEYNASDVSVTTSITYSNADSSNTISKNLKGCTK